MKLAIGATYISNSVTFTRFDASSAPTLAVTPVTGSEPYNVWATFAQLNVPVFGDSNAIPFFRRLEVELSWRHDQYHGSLSGPTSNPKVGMTWLLDENAGLSLRGSWGTSFRFANAGEYSPVFSTALTGFDTPSQFANSTPTA